MTFINFARYMNPKLYKYKHPFYLECGGCLPELEIAYHTFGKLNRKKDNVIWVCHALTANSNVFDWWSGLFGKGKIFDPKKYFIVCANIIGSCYGTTGPLSINRKTKKAYYNTFPQVTVRDMVKAHILLKEELGIEKIHTGIGGSLGGYQLLEWAIAEKELFENLVLMVTSAKESSWGRGVHAAQRMAIEADFSFGKKNKNAGRNGLKAARAIGMLTYRNYHIFCEKQKDSDEEMHHFSATSYLKHQGEKLANRFNAYSYWHLTKTMDSHHLGRGRGKLENVLSQIQPKTLIIGIGSDILCPTQEQKFLAEHIPGSTLHIIDSHYGHDGFLIEHEQLNRCIANAFR